MIPINQHTETRKKTCKLNQHTSVNAWGRKIGKKKSSICFINDKRFVKGFDLIDSESHQLP